MKTRIELSKAYKKGIEVERERVLKLIEEVFYGNMPKHLKNNKVEELKSKIEG